MKDLRNIKALLFTLLVFVSIVFSAACTSREDFVGMYSAKADDCPGTVETVMELKEDGQGFLRRGDGEVSFRWSVNENEIRPELFNHLNSKQPVIGSLNLVITAR